MVTWFSAREEGAPAILDKGYLQRLSKHIGTRETQELLADGMIDLADRLEQLKRHGQSGDVTAVAKLVHEIAGAAGHLGLTAMSHAAFEVSRRARENPDAAADQLAALVVDLQEQSIAALADYCSANADSQPPGGSKSGSAV